MDLYVTPCLLEHICSYMTWGDLRRHKQVPDVVWKRISDHFRTDLHFDNEYQMHMSTKRSYRNNFLFLMNAMINLVKEWLESLVPKILWGDYDFVVLASRYSGLIMGRVPATLKVDRNFILGHVADFPGAIRYFDAVVKADKEIVLTAVKAGGGKRLLMDIDVRFLSDPEIVFEACKNDWEAMQQADPSLRSNPDFVASLLPHKPDVLFYVNHKLKSDPVWMWQIIQPNPKLILYADASLRNNKEWMLKVIQLDGSAIKHIGPELQTDVDIVIEATKQNWDFIKFLKYPMYSTKSFLLKAADIVGMKALRYACHGMQSDPDLRARVIEYERGNKTRWVLG